MTNKRLTKKEKVLRAQAKKELQEDGILPPDKPRLNRKKFAKEVMEEFRGMDLNESMIYLWQSLSCMVSKDMTRVSTEQVGVLKLVKIAIETKKFEEALKDQEKSQYKIDEYLEQVVIPIRNL